MTSKIAVISVAIFFMVESQSGNEKSWSIPTHSFSKWMHDYQLNDTVVIGVVSTLMFLLLLDQIFTTRVLWKLTLNASEKELLETAVPAATEDLGKSRRTSLG